MRGGAHKIITFQKDILYIRIFNECRMSEIRNCEILETVKKGAAYY
jgi:hypothetical protein